MDNGAYYYCLLALLPLLYFVVVKFWWRTSFGSHSHGLRLPPGPWQFPIIGSIHHLRGSLVHRALRDLSLRHGPLMFLKLGEVPVVVLSTPDAAKEFMKTHDAVFATRPMTLNARVFTKDGPGIVVAPYGDHWRQLRKICIMELLSARGVLSFAPVHEEEAVRLVQAVVDSAAAMAPLADLSKLVAVYIADAWVRAIVGRRFKETDTLLRYVDESVRLAGGFTPIDLFPSSLLVRVLTLRRAVRRVEDFRESLFAFMDGVICDCEHLERKKSCEGEEEAHDQEDLVDVLLRIQLEGNLKFPLTMSTIEAVIFDLIAGGIETAASTLQWAMAELMRNPAAMSKAQAEVRGVYTGQTHGSGIRPNSSESRRNSSISLVIKETLRLHVPGPLLIPRECQEHCRVLGYDMPKGTMVLVNAWAISRNPDYWEEPDTFSPERFVGDTMDFRGNDFEFLPFGAGRRICPGMAFGLANMELGLASLLFHFDWSLPDGVVPSEMDMTETMGITARRKADVLSATPCVVPLCRAELNQIHGSISIFIV